MANKVVATLDIACWKEHECCSCGTTFRYLLTQRREGVGASEAQAREMATALVLRSVKGHVEPLPCPTCGLYQPDMIGFWRSRWHKGLAWGSAASFTFVLTIATIPWMSIEWSLWATVSLAGLTVLGHLLVLGWRFNQDPALNLVIAQQAVEQGRMQLTSAYAPLGEDAQERDSFRNNENLGIEEIESRLMRPNFPEKKGNFSLPNTSAIAKFPYFGKSLQFRQVAVVPIVLLMVLSTIFIAATEIARRCQDWPWNTGWNPPVAGPGDVTTVRLPKHIDALKGLWHGTVSAHIENFAELGLLNDSIEAEASRDKWNNEILLGDNKRATNEITTPWVRITIPDVAQPRGKTLLVRIILLVRYPSARFVKEGQVFEELQTEVKHSATLALAAPRAGELFVLLWWGTGLGGAVLVVVAGFFLVIRADWLSARSLPSRVYPVDQ